MECNIDKMVEKQEQMNRDIANQPLIKEEAVETVCYMEKQAITKTHIVEHKGEVLLTRYMYNKVYKVVFAIDVKVVDVIDYLDLSDGMFIKCSNRFN